MLATGPVTGSTTGSTVLTTGPTGPVSEPTTGSTGLVTGSTAPVTGPTTEADRLGDLADRATRIGPLVNRTGDRAHRLGDLIDHRAGRVGDRIWGRRGSAASWGQESRERAASARSMGSKVWVGGPAGPPGASATDGAGGFGACTAGGVGGGGRSERSSPAGRASSVRAPAGRRPGRPRRGGHRSAHGPGRDRVRRGRLGRARHRSGRRDRGRGVCEKSANRAASASGHRDERAANRGLVDRVSQACFSGPRMLPGGANAVGHVDTRAKIAPGQGPCAGSPGRRRSRLRVRRAYPL